MNIILRRSLTGVAESPWNQWQNVRGLGGRMRVESVAEWSWNTQADIPIVAMTANAFDEDRRTCIQAGMNDFISKPIDINTFYVTLLKWLSMPCLPKSLNQISGHHQFLVQAGHDYLNRRKQKTPPFLKGLFAL